jgi:histidinol-phosphate aminotransferase
MNKALSALIRPHFLTMQGYVSAGMEVKKDDSIVFMNANENPYTLPGLEGMNRYPEPQPSKLLDAYAELYGVEADNIVATRGADEAIAILTRLFCEPDQDSILTMPPTFGIYGVLAHTIPAKVLEIPLRYENNRFEACVDIIHDMYDEPLHEEDKIEVDGPLPKIIYLCSPNNPTGNDLKWHDMEAICTFTKGKAIVVIDETYVEFSRQGSMLEYMKNNPNMIILRTLSKSYSLAGQRMGCLISFDKDFIKLVRTKALETYPLPRASVEAALKVMQPGMLEIARENREKIISERERLKNHLNTSELVWQVYDSDANFLLVRMEHAKEFVDYCKKEKMILRDLSNKSFTTDCIRISISLPEDNDRLVQLLTKFESSKAKG